MTDEDENNNGDDTQQEVVIPVRDTNTYLDKEEK